MCPRYPLILVPAVSTSARIRMVYDARMNTKIVAGAAAGIIVVVGGYLLLRDAPAQEALPPAEPAATSTAASPAPDTAEAPAAVPAAEAPATPAVVQDAPIRQVVRITLAFDGPTFTSSSAYPMLSGTGGNVSSARILIQDSAGTGLVASEIPIENGRWSYYSPIALAPGSYTVYLSAQGLVVKAALVVTGG